MQTINEMLFHKKNINVENNEKLPRISLWDENESELNLFETYFLSFVQS